MEAFCSVIPRSSWNDYQCRVANNTEKVLDILDEYGVSATFFCLGWVAKKYPGLIKAISKRGHEIASHGFFHLPVWKQSKSEFRKDVRVAKKVLEDITGKQILGYRAPTYSITLKTLWALEILSEEGYVYDSSIFPTKHDLYGISSAPRFLFRIKEYFTLLESDIIEFPVSTFKIFTVNIPVSGGGYFRLFPWFLIKRALWWINQVEKRPFMFYMHPWEFDPDQPRIKNASFLSRFRHYVNLHKTGEKFRTLLSKFRFTRAIDIINNN